MLTAALFFHLRQSRLGSSFLEVSRLGSSRPISSRFYSHQLRLSHHIPTRLLSSRLMSSFIGAAHVRPIHLDSFSLDSFFLRCAPIYPALNPTDLCPCFFCSSRPTKPRRILAYPFRARLGPVLVYRLDILAHLRSSAFVIILPWVSSHSVDLVLSHLISVTLTSDHFTCSTISLVSVDVRLTYHVSSPVHLSSSRPIWCRNRSFSGTISTSLG